MEIILFLASEKDYHLVKDDSLLFYTHPNNRAMLAVRKVTTIAVPNVITTLRVAHFNDLVSL